MKWDKVSKNWSNKICGRQPLADHITSNFLEAVFQNFYLVHSWILCPKYRASKYNDTSKYDDCNFSYFRLCLFAKEKMCLFLHIRRWPYIWNIFIRETAQGNFIRWSYFLISTLYKVNKIWPPKLIHRCWSSIQFLSLCYFKACIIIPTHVLYFTKANRTL